MPKAPIPVILEAQMDRPARATDPVSEIRGWPVSPWWVLIASFNDQFSIAWDYLGKES